MKCFASRDQVRTPDGIGTVLHKELKTTRGQQGWTGRYWVRLLQETDTGRRQGFYWHEHLRLHN